MYLQWLKTRGSSRHTPEQKHVGQLIDCLLDLASSFPSPICSCRVRGFSPHEDHGCTQSHCPWELKSSTPPPRPFLVYYHDTQLV
ncbi:unnamed protein product [Periconia digitata]|uniref:Uncharacterized protein n=1 Tax=Periconia digitata TaxID=1303443 RepID=A0A9W4XX10_9PLEO|nr:unnamed protein product [Periconia digitata]